MQTIEYRTMDRTAWQNGPWDAEPDKKQWQDEATGLPCLIVRNNLGALCGYVGVSPDHPLHGKSYNDADDIEIHGGLTFAGSCRPGPEATSICHKPEPGEPDSVWWFGFDCSHCHDMTPSRPEWGGDVYRDFEYVAAECKSLARQLAAVVQ